MVDKQVEIQVLIGSSVIIIWKHNKSSIFQIFFGNVFDDLISFRL